MECKCTILYFLQTNYYTNCEAVLLDMNEENGMNYSCTLVPNCGFVGKNSTSILIGTLSFNVSFSCLSLIFSTFLISDA